MSERAKKNKLLEKCRNCPSSLKWNLVLLLWFAMGFAIWADFNPAKLEQFCGSKTLFPVISLVLTVEGIIFGIFALSDSSKQENELEKLHRKLEKTENELEGISDSLSTFYIGKFPKHLTEIKKLVECSHKSLRIMVDCVDYGSFSAPDFHEELLQSIIDARKKHPKVKVQILLCGDMQHISRNSPFFGKTFEELFTDPELKDDFIKCLNDYLTYHPEFQRPSNENEFKKLLSDYQDSVWKRLESADVEKYKLNKVLIDSQNYPGIFFWVEDNDNAVFLLSHAGLKAQEIAFRTHDARLIEIFQTTFNQHWPKENLTPINNEV